MKQLRKTLSKVCTIAQTILRHGWQKSLSEAMKAAWLLVKLWGGLRVEFKFYSKTSDKVKTYIGTFGCIDTLQKGYIRFSSLVTSKIDGIDFEVEPRSFRIENLMF